MLCIHKTVEAPVKRWHNQGLRALLYLDDGIVAVSGAEEAKEASVRVRRDL